jgi:hypothetical protein
LYDVTRIKDPKINGSEAAGPEVDAFVKKSLQLLRQAGKGIRIVTSTVHSPSTLAVIADFIAKYPTTKHINYDAVSYTGIIQANQNSFGKAVLPHYNFDKADVL